MCGVVIVCVCVLCERLHLKMAKEGDNALYPIAVLIDELRNDDVNVSLENAPTSLVSVWLLV